jgi:elongation factor G
MKVYQGADIRNIGVVGHGDSGKTSLVSCLLFTAGAVNRLGNVDDGTTITDFDDEEIERKLSLSSASCFLEWKKTKLNILDTPGYANFVADAKAALRVVDGALLLVHSVSGVQVITERVWKYAEEFNLPVILATSMLDRERASFERTLEAVRERLSRKAVPMQIPIGSEHDLRGIIDLVRMKAHVYSPGDQSGKAKAGEVPADLKEAAEAARGQLVEAIAETEDSLMETFFEKGELSQQEIESGLCAAVKARKIFPIICFSGSHNIGAGPLLDAAVAYLPSPAEVGPFRGSNPISNEELERKGSSDEPASAFVFKTFADPYAGRISLFRVYSGIIRPDTTLQNFARSSTERLGAVSSMQGKTPMTVSELHAGDIGAVMKLKETRTGDTLCDKDHPIAYAPVVFPTPAISYAIEPKSQGDEEKISVALARLCEEDPVLHVGRDPQTHELLVSGTGLEHVKVAMDKMSKKFGAHATLKQPKVPYRETIRKKSEGMYRHKKQTGGAGQFAEVHMRIEPLDRGAGFEFKSEIFGGAISRNFWPSIEKGIRSVMEKGVIAGYPVSDVKAVITDGKEHSVDSKDIAFQVAGREAFKICVEQARPVLLEPIMHVEITIPSECMGDVIGDLTSRRGRLETTDTVGHSQVIIARAPLAEMLEYAPTLKSITSDRGTFTMELEGYEEVPATIQEKIVSAHKAASGKPESEGS